MPPAELRDINQQDYQALDESDNLVNATPFGAASVLAKIREGLAQRWWGQPGWRRVGEVQHPIKVPRTGWSRFPHLGRLVQSE